jgi:hypothetical protein
MDLNAVELAIELRIKKLNNARKEETEHKCYFYWMAVCSILNYIVSVHVMI